MRVAMDLWSAVLRRRFGIPRLDYALLGRWVGHAGLLAFRASRVGERSRSEHRCRPQLAALPAVWPYGTDPTGRGATARTPTAVLQARIGRPRMPADPGRSEFGSAGRGFESLRAGQPGRT